MKDKLRILVLCTGNSCRSHMAEGFFRRYGGDNIEVKSAGLEPAAAGVNPLAIRVMKEVGIDISGQTSKHLNEYLNEDFDYVITVCDNAAANCPVFPSHPERSRRATRLHWPFPDPALVTSLDQAREKGTESEILRVFKKVRDDIGGKVEGWVSKNRGE